MTDQNFNQIINNFFKNDYRERGKIKWNGYFLSDHTSSLKREHTERAMVTDKLPIMPLNEIQTVLQHAYANYQIVTVQQNIKTNHGALLPNITGLVDGFSDQGVYLNQQLIVFEDMRAVIKE